MKYGAILADPPWHWQARSLKGEGRSPGYKRMDLAAIKSMPIAEMAADDSVLFLWAIDTMLPPAFEVIEAWGFTYKTVAFTWIKTNSASPGFFTGLGYWTRCNPEQCLLATRGRPQRLHKDVQQLIVAPRREHSRKPGEVRARIQRLVPGPYLELFARESTPDWDTHGDEKTLFDPEALKGNGTDG
jgi:N6-adenosine-specific RNA methylase IME4